MINEQREARYTEYLGEYLKTHQLPTIFNQIEGFDTLFIATYVDREIGFETEDLFEIKLEAMANDIIPLYKRRMEQYTNAIANLSTAKKIYTDESKIAPKKVVDEMEVAPKKVTNTELPLNTQTALPNVIQESIGYTDTTTRSEDERIDTVTRTEKGLTTLEAYEVLEKLQSQVYNITNALLKEFNPLFMGVF